MRRRTAALLGGGAVAAVLALGSLFGGVLNEPRPTGATAQAAPADRPRDRALGVRPRRAARRRRSRSSRRSSAPAPAIPTVSGRSVSRTSSAGARPATRPSSRSRSAPCGAPSRPGRDDPAVTLGLGNLALIRHDFRAALELGRRARRLAPDASRPLRRRRRRAPRARPLRARRSRPSSGWSPSSRRSRRTPASPTRASSRATGPARSPR